MGAQTIMGMMMEQALVHYGQTRLPLYRLFTALKPHMLGEVAKERNYTVDDFVKRYKFKGVSDVCDVESLTPLMCAAIEGDANMIKQLVAEKADLNAGTPPNMCDEYGI